MIVKKCKVCNTDISQKRTDTIFCSKKCNNHFHGKLRTKRKRQIRKLEKQNLDKLLKLVPKKVLWFWVTYKSKNDVGLFSDYLYQSEIHTTKDWINKIQQVSVIGFKKNAKPIILNSYRARKLIKEINNLNYENTK